MQEIKAQQADMAAEMLNPVGYYGYFHYAEKKGYSGVGIYCKAKPDAVIEGLGGSNDGVQDIDSEGRYLECQFGNLSVISLYLPSGSSGEERQAFKFSVMTRFMLHMQTLIKSGREVIICGDWNIAHKPEDLVNWKANQKYSGFLPDERAWLDKLFVEHGFVDAFRELPQEPEQYTWWSMRTNAWDKNAGWRIDYHVLTPNLKGTVSATSIYRAEKFSDHAPVVIDYRKP